MTKLEDPFPQLYPFHRESVIVSTVFFFSSGVPIISRTIFCTSVLAQGDNGGRDGAGGVHVSKDQNMTMQRRWRKKDWYKWVAPHGSPRCNLRES